MMSRRLRFGRGCALGTANASSSRGVLCLLGRACSGRVVCGAAGQVWSMWSLLDMGGDNYIGELLLGQSWVEAAGLGSAWHPRSPPYQELLPCETNSVRGGDTLAGKMLHEGATTQTHRTGCQTRGPGVQYATVRCLE